MGFCPSCGASVESDKKYCPECGHMMDPVAGGYPQQAQPQQPQQTVYSPQVNMPNDSGSFGWAALGFFIPIVGLVLFLVWKDEKPKSAKQAGIGALVSAIVAVVIYLLCFAAACGSVMWASSLY